jgi:hypothetical protein
MSEFDKELLEIDEKMEKLLLIEKNEEIQENENEWKIKEKMECQILYQNFLVYATQFNHKLCTELLKEELLKNPNIQNSGYLEEWRDMVCKHIIYDSIYDQKYDLHGYHLEIIYENEKNVLILYDEIIIEKNLRKIMIEFNNIQIENRIQLNDLLTQIEEDLIKEVFL